MLKRKVTQKLEAWLGAPKRKALLISGARQTGKTFAVREFAKAHFENYLEVNFLDDEQAASFLSSASNSEELISRLSLLAEKPFSAGRTLVFLDEIQVAKDILTLSKFLIESNRFELIMSGSLLGVELKGIRSFPVGYLHEERLYPLDFEEFCWSQGVPQAILDEIHSCYESKTPVEQTLHERLVRIFRLYLVVGGMPEAVQTYLDTDRDLGAVREIHSDTINLYRKDISQYAPERTLFILSIFDALPSELAKVNKRFVLQSLKKGATYERFQDDFEWLSAAGVVLPACLVSEPKYPLIRTRERRKFKLYSLDVGMLIARYPRTVAMEALQGSKNVNFGAVYENVIAQELAAAGFDLDYYNNNRKGEMDFLIEDAKGKVIPIEVKSGKDYKFHSALNNLLKTKDYGIEYAYVFSEHNVSQGMREDKMVYYLPLYMSMCLASERTQDVAITGPGAINFDDWV